MIFGAGLLLLLNLAFVQMAFTPDKDCDFAESLTSTQTKPFQNPNWPATYMSGASCRWTFDCPLWFACRLKCHDVGLPQTDDCYMDRLLVSGTGNLELEGAQVFCGRTEINYRSVGSRMTLALVASKLSPGGRFRCTISSEPWTRPWFVSPCTPNPELLEKRGSTSAEDEQTPLPKKIMTPAQDIGSKRMDGRISTGLIQSRVPFTAYETERLPHAKNEKPEIRSKYIDGISSYVKYVPIDSIQPKYIKVDQPYNGQSEEEALLSNDKPVEVHAITAARHGKTSIPMAKAYKVGFTNANRIKINDSPFSARVEDPSPILEIVQAEPSLVKPGKGGFDKRVNRRADASRKHKLPTLSSHIRRSHKGSRRVKKVQRGSRHIRHELLRAPKINKNKRMKVRFPRIAHRTGVPHTRRVRTQLKRSTKRPTIPPYIRGIRSNNGRPVDMFTGKL